jgi:hypothetical protein
METTPVEDILTGLARIEERQTQSMATEAQLLQALADADAATNEIAEDIAEILAKEPISDDAMAAVTAHVEKLRGVAAVVPEDEETPAEEPTV